MKSKPLALTGGRDPGFVTGMGKQVDVVFF